MDRETIIKLALEAESPAWGDWFTDEDALERFFNAAYTAGAAAEREASAKVCEEVERKATRQPPMVGQGCQACATAIRARGNT